MTHMAAALQIPIVSARFPLASLAESFAHCNEAANFLARFAASHRLDPETSTTVLSTYLNEVLEFAYRGLAVSADDGAELVVALFDDGDSIVRAEFETAIDDAHAAALAELEAIRATTYDGPVRVDLASPIAGLAEIVALHAVELAANRKSEGNKVTLTMRAKIT